MLVRPELFSESVDEDTLAAPPTVSDLFLFDGLTTVALRV